MDKQLSNHFKLSEFACRCGCGGANPNTKLLRLLEQLRSNLNCKYITVTSGYRCPSHSVKEGGYATDAHTKNLAADVMCYDQSNRVIPVETVAAEAERIGFTGIGLMNGGAIHLDVRDESNYYNAHWFGDERTGENIKTFQGKETIKDLSETLITIGGKQYKIRITEV